MDCGKVSNSFIGKLAGVSGSLALLLHLVADPAEARFVAVTSTTVERVKRLVTEFIISHAMEFYRSVSAASPNGDHLRKLASWILTNSKQRIVASDITANVAGFRGLGLFDLNRRVSPLVAAGWLTPCDPKLGPVNNAWIVHPAVPKQFEERRRSEETQKAEIARLMNSPRSRS